MLGQKEEDMNWFVKPALIVACACSVAAAAAIALFWGAWHLVVGSIPAVNSINMWPGWTISLPFAISRGWDMLLAFVGTAAIVMLFVDKDGKFQPGDDFVYMIMAIPFALVLGYLGMIFGIITGSFFLYFVLIEPAPGTTAISTALKFGLILGLALGLIYGIAAGFLVFKLTGGPVVIFSLIKKIIPKRGRQPATS
jgi:hypothetical protein